MEKVSINTDIIYEKFKRENIFDLSNKKSIVYISEKKIQNMNDECIIIKKSINKPNYKIHKTEILGFYII